jgi:hypothetical protein
VFLLGGGCGRGLLERLEFGAERGDLRVSLLLGGQFGAEGGDEGVCGWGVVSGKPRYEVVQLTLRPALRLLLQLVEVGLRVSHADGMQVLVFQLERFQFLG